jgi:uncharacterized protein YbjT (DUF2867 family)
VQRFVYTSTRVSTLDRISPLIRCKRETEQMLRSGLNIVVFRADIFMDTSFAMRGSAIPLRGADGATILRPFALSNRYFGRIRDNIQEKRLAVIPGDGTTRHAFICVDDVAQFLASAACSGPPGFYDIGGPEALTFTDVVRRYERVLGVTLRLRRMPALAFRIAIPLLRPFTSAGENLMALNYIAAKVETWPEPESAAAFGVSLTSAEDFLRKKAGLQRAV